MFRKSKDTEPYVTVFQRCHGDVKCEERSIKEHASSGVPLDIGKDVYAKCRAWLVEREAELLEQGATIRAGWVRDNITEHDRRYDYKES